VVEAEAEKTGATQVQVRMDGQKKWLQLMSCYREGHDMKGLTETTHHTQDNTCTYVYSIGNTYPCIKPTRNQQYNLRTICSRLHQSDRRATTYWDDDKLIFSITIIDRQTNSFIIIHAYNSAAVSISRIIDYRSGLQNVIKRRWSVPLLQTQLLRKETG
jgi:hypothetical protein